MKTNLPVLQVLGELIVVRMRSCFCFLLVVFQFVRGCFHYVYAHLLLQWLLVGGFCFVTFLIVKWAFVFAWNP